MTGDEQLAIAKAVVTADGGCSVCVKYLAVELMRSMPSVDWAKAIADASGRGQGFEDEIRRTSKHPYA